MPSGPEWILVLVIILVIFGGSQLPKLARNVGKAQQEFKTGLAESQERVPHSDAQSADRSDQPGPRSMN